MSEDRCANCGTTADAHDYDGACIAAELECLEHGGDCHGEVDYRMPLSGTERAFPRCEHHWELRLDEQDRINRQYGGACPPRDFDPTYAGESWDED